MTIHVNIGEAKTRLSELVAAALRGEEVVLARAGTPTVRLVPVDPDQGKREMAERRRKWFGSMRGVWPEGAADLFLEPMSPEELAEFYQGPLFPDER